MNLNSSLFWFRLWKTTEVRFSLKMCFCGLTISFSLANIYEFWPDNLWWIIREIHFTFTPTVHYTDLVYIFFIFTPDKISSTWQRKKSSTWNWWNFSRENSCFSVIEVCWSVLGNFRRFAQIMERSIHNPFPNNFNFGV